MGQIVFFSMVETPLQSPIRANSKYELTMNQKQYFWNIAIPITEYDDISSHLFFFFTYRRTYYFFRIELHWSFITCVTPKVTGRNTPRKCCLQDVKRVANNNNYCCRTVDRNPNNNRIQHVVHKVVRDTVGEKKNATPNAWDNRSWNWNVKTFFFHRLSSFSDSFGTYKHALLICTPLQTSFYKFFIFLLRDRTFKCVTTIISAPLWPGFRLLA